MNNKRLFALREYLEYIPKRIKYVKTLTGGMITNEIRFWKALKLSIKHWREGHLICYEHLRGNLTIAQARNLIGSSERNVYRLLTKQTTEFINFLKEEESKFDKLYPYIPVTDIFENDLLEELYG